MVRYQPPKDWQQWVDWLAAGLHGRNRWRLSLVVMGIVFARGRRTVTSWLRAVGITDDFADYYYFLQPLGRKTKEMAERLLMLLFVAVAAGRSRPAGRRRLADQTLRPARARRRHPSQSDTGPGRSQIPVRPHLGDDLAGAASSAVAHDRPAADRVAVCAGQRHRQDSGQVPLGVPHEVGTGRRASAAVRRACCKQGEKPCGWWPTERMPSGRF